jgi:hypothetical protein
VGQDESSAFQVGAAEVCTFQMGITDVRALQLSLAQVRSVEYGPDEACALQGGLAEDSAFQENPAQVCAIKMGRTEVCSFKMSTTEVRTLQVKIWYRAKFALLTLLCKPEYIGSGKPHPIKRPLSLPMVRLSIPTVEVALQLRLPLLANRVTPSQTDRIWMWARAGRLLLSHRSLLSLAAGSSVADDARGAMGWDAAVTRLPGHIPAQVKTRHQPRNYLG